MDRTMDTYANAVRVTLTGSPSRRERRAVSALRRTHRALHTPRWWTRSQRVLEARIARRQLNLARIILADESIVADARDRMGLDT